MFSVVFIGLENNLSLVGGCREFKTSWLYLGRL